VARSPSLAMSRLYWSLNTHPQRLARAFLIVHNSSVRLRGVSVAGNWGGATCRVSYVSACPLLILMRVFRLPRRLIGRIPDVSQAELPGFFPWSSRFGRLAGKKIALHCLNAKLVTALSLPVYQTLIPFRRSGCEYTFMVAPRRNPIKVCPLSRANSTARLDGATPRTPRGCAPTAPFA